MRSGAGERMAPPRDAYLALGANLGNRAHTLARAVELLDATPGLTLRAVSSVYETAPVGVTDQPAFLNLVAYFECRLSARELLAIAQEIERRLGRVRGPRWGPRTIDIDLLLLGDERVDEPGLTIPHPELTRRQFVLVPLAEIAPTLMLPGGRTAAELSGGESEAVRRLGKLTELAGGDA